ncbi:hypothetical protein NPIL_423211 [Nephila pilipes]|uniref:Uncharacterized protein n=1 Tax=Nephila pilipes TaxID=299642 RepID=A0A8X6NBU1_NEPPI|nr:hypothetical protein NPIL_423211 [Nephila pilipes]
MLLYILVNHSLQGKEAFVRVYVCLSSFTRPYAIEKATDLEICAMIRFLQAKGEKAGEINQQINEILWFIPLSLRRPLHVTCLIQKVQRLGGSLHYACPGKSRQTRRGCLRPDIAAPSLNLSVLDKIDPAFPSH